MKDTNRASAWRWRSVNVRWSPAGPGHPGRRVKDGQMSSGRVLP